MKRFLYLIGFLVLLLVLKAFYLDPYIAEKYGDTNESLEANGTAEANETTTEASNEVNKTKAPLHSNDYQSKDKMPLEKVGDSIANTLEDKIRTP